MVTFSHLLPAFFFVVVNHGTGCACLQRMWVESTAQGDVDFLAHANRTESVLTTNCTGNVSALKDFKKTGYRWLRFC